MKITVPMVAKLLGWNQQKLRMHLRLEKVNFGTAVKMPGSDRWTYSFLPGPLAAAAGIPVGELERRLSSCEPNSAAS